MGRSNRLIEDILDGELIAFKIGGSSSGTYEQVSALPDLTKRDSNRRLAVISGPGTSDNCPIKLTDLLIAYSNRSGDELGYTESIPESEKTQGMVLGEHGKRTEEGTLVSEIYRIFRSSFVSDGSNNKLIDAAMDALRFVGNQRTYVTEDTLRKRDQEDENGHFAAFPEFYQSVIGNEGEEIDVLQHSVNIQALGELFNMHNLAGAYRKAGFDNVRVVDPRNFLRANGGNPLEGNILLGNSEIAFEQWVTDEQTAFDKDAIHIMAGYIAETPDGKTVLLGRDGTNTSLVMASHLFKPQYSENFSDVPGVFKITPGYVDVAEDERLIENIIPAEFRELAARVNFKVFKERSLALLERIGAFTPIHIKSFDNSEEYGTAIVSDRDPVGNEIVGIGIRKDVTYVEITDARMADKPGYLADVTTCLRDLGANIVHIQQGETQLRMYVTKDSYRNAGTRPDQIRNHLSRTLDLAAGGIDLTHYGSIIGVVGSHLKESKVMLRTLGAYDDAGIEHAQFYDGSHNAGYTVVARQHVGKAMKLLHQEFLAKK